jgi:DNA adenine methylase
LTDFIISNFPNNYQELAYCEPMCAGASIFLNKKPSKEEIINDIDKGIVSVYKALRDEPDEFIDRLKKIKYTEKTFKAAQQRASQPFDDYIEHGVNEYVVRRMSRGGMKKAFAWSDRQRGGQPGDVNAWETMLKELPKLAERAKNATILNRSIFDIIKTFDEEDTLFYLDPPYLHETRSDGATSVYDHEMTAEDHLLLLNIAKGLRGKVLISGYSSPLYNRNLKGWRIKKKSVANHSSQSKTKETRTEILWMNY